MKKLLILICLVLIPITASSGVGRVGGLMRRIPIINTPSGPVDPYYKTDHCLFFVDFSNSDSLDHISGTYGTVTNGSYVNNDKTGKAYHQDGSFACIQWEHLSTALQSRANCTLVIRFKAGTVSQSSSEGYLFGYNEPNTNGTTMMFPNSKTYHMTSNFRGNTVTPGTAPFLLKTDSAYYLAGATFGEGGRVVFYDTAYSVISTDIDTLPTYGYVYMNIYWWPGYYNNWDIDFAGIFDYTFNEAEWATFKTWADARTD